MGLRESLEDKLKGAEMRRLAEEHHDREEFMWWTGFTEGLRHALDLVGGD